MDLHGRFGHAKLASDDLVWIAQAKARENSVLPLGKLGSMPNAVGTIAELDAGRLLIEKGALMLVKTVGLYERRRPILLLKVRKWLLLGKVVVPAFDGKCAGRRVACHDYGRREISSAIQYG